MKQARWTKSSVARRGSFSGPQAAWCGRASRAFACGSRRAPRPTCSTRRDEGDGACRGRSDRRSSNRRSISRSSRASRAGSAWAKASCATSRLLPRPARLHGAQRRRHRQAGRPDAQRLLGRNPDVPLAPRHAGRLGSREQVVFNTEAHSLRKTWPLGSNAKRAKTSSSRF